jgi:3-deoxy-D-manno-octulosonic-acid transferase
LNLFILYNIFVFLYTLGIRVASVFNLKARLWVKGRRGELKKIKESISQNPDKKKTAWFHCASLGEFEQGRPVIEAFRESHPDHKIFLTFFSPSGYEIRKNYPGADHVFYLPADTPGMAARFVKILSPDIVFFIKYEYWYNYLSVLKKHGIPVYMVSAIFRKSQPFFRGYGSWFRKQLENISWFFVQDKDSMELLHSIGINQVSVSGDTRFDRVDAIALLNKSVDGMNEFCKDSKVLLAGSTWPEDEKILIPFILSNKEKFKFIIAPHEVHKERIDALMEQLGTGALRFSMTENPNLQESRVLVIDSIGLLSTLYRYAYAAYIGGGFGAGIHNILEPAAFGVPMILGPNFERFREARELISEKGAFTILTAEDLRLAIYNLVETPGEHARASAVCSAYVNDHKGATEHIKRRIGR